VVVKCWLNRNLENGKEEKQHLARISTLMQKEKTVRECFPKIKGESQLLIIQKQMKKGLFR